MTFIPDRPSELVSGGYDSALLHFDIGQGNILSRFDISEHWPFQTRTTAHTVQVHHLLLREYRCHRHSSCLLPLVLLA